MKKLLYLIALVLIAFTPLFTIYVHDYYNAHPATTQWLYLFPLCVLGIASIILLTYYKRIK